MNWEKAKKFCSDLQAEMVVLESDEEFKEVAKMTASLLKKKWRYWVGGKMNAGEWITYKGDKAPFFKLRLSRPGKNGECLRVGGGVGALYPLQCKAKKIPGGYTLNPLCKIPFEASKTPGKNKQLSPGTDDLILSQ